MSGPSRTIPRVISSSSRTAIQTQTRSSSSTSTTPPLRAALLLSRPPLLTPTPSQLETTYHAYNSRLRLALSNPVPTSFYFKPGSLPLRRFQRSSHHADLEAFGPRIAGKAPDVGELPAETLPEVLSRDHWEKADSDRGERSLERFPEEEVFCLVETGGKWGFPRAEVKKGEGLDEAIRRGLTGVEGELGGKGMDSWIVARKPVGVVREGDARTFFLRAHILAGEPIPSPSAEWKSWAWLTPTEIQQRLSSQGEEATWESIKGMFGLPSEEADL